MQSADCRLPAVGCRLLAVGFGDFPRLAANCGDKAAKLVARGVRRVFAIDVERSRALEWSSALGTWSVLDPGGCIEDPALAAPLPVDALLHDAKVDDAVARALLVKHNPVLEAARAEGVAEGLARGKAEAVVAVLDARGIALDSAERARVLGERDPAIVAGWIGRAATCADAAGLFDLPARSG